MAAAPSCEEFISRIRDVTERFAFMPAVEVVNWSYFKETLSAFSVLVSISTTLLKFPFCLLSTECMFFF
jgi:hypothetical protein